MLLFQNAINHLSWTKKNQIALFSSFNITVFLFPVKMIHSFLEIFLCNLFSKKIFVNSYDRDFEFSKLKRGFEIMQNMFESKFETLISPWFFILE